MKNPEKSGKNPENGDLAELTKRNASDRLGDLVPWVRARTFQGFSRHLASRHLNLSSSSKFFSGKRQKFPNLFLKFPKLFTDFRTFSRSGN